MIWSTRNHIFTILSFKKSEVKLLCPWLHMKYAQECIPVGCVPPAHWPYLVVSAMHAPLQCMPPALHAPHHACPPAMYAPHHACPLPCMPPATHTPCHASIPCHPWPPPPTPPCHACPLPHMPPPAMHAPLPCMPPPLWTEWLTDRCKT